jgi:cytochrome b561
MPAWERCTAHLSHALFYAFMVASVVAGYLTSSFSGFGPKLFGMPLPYWGWDDPALRQRFVDWHRVITLVFAVLIALHALAALKHALVDRDGVLARMLPRRRSGLRSDS